MAMNGWKKYAKGWENGIFLIFDPVGLARGLTLMWDEGVNVRCVWNSERIIQRVIEVADTPTYWDFLACHGTPYLANKRLFWDQVKSLIDDFSGPWLIFGDLN